MRFFRNRRLFRSTAGTVLVAVVLATLRSAYSQEPDKYLRQGLAAFGQQKFDTAIESFLRGRQQNANDQKQAGKFNFYLGLTRQTQADVQGATNADAVKRWLRESQRYYQQATEALPKSGGSWNNLGLVSAKLDLASDFPDPKREQEVKRSFQQAISVQDDQQATYLINYADFLQAKGEQAHAIRFYRLAMEQEPVNQRVREQLSEILLEGPADLAMKYMWEMFDDGHVDYSFELAVSTLVKGRQPEYSSQLFNCVARSLSRLRYDPKVFHETAMAKQLANLRNDSNPAIEEIFILHRATSSQPRPYRWWREQVDLNRQNYPPPGDWPQKGFTDLIRSIGTKYEHQGNTRLAEQYYQLAYHLTESYLDADAIVNLANLWERNKPNKNEPAPELLAFFVEEEPRLFREKGAAIRESRYERMYEIHRALAIIYMHLDEWRNDTRFRNAEYQVTDALKDARQFNDRASRDKRPERIVEWELASRLADWYVVKNEHAKAFDLRVAQAHHLWRHGESAAAARLFRPIAGQDLPNQTDPENEPKFEELKAKSRTDGSLTPATASFDHLDNRFQVRLPEGRRGELLIGDLPAASTLDISGLIEYLLQRASPNAETQLGRTTRQQILFLPEDVAPILSIKFEGAGGTVEFKDPAADDSRAATKGIQLPFIIKSEQPLDAIPPTRFVLPTTVSP